jgi:putative transposase
MKKGKGKPTMAISDKLLDELLKDYKTPEDIHGEHGIINQLKKRIYERVMDGEMTHHLGYDKYAPSGRNSGNSRNGKSGKTLITDSGELPIEVPRDRNSTFEPLMIPKGQTRFNGFDDKVISLYARGMTTRDIAAHLKEMYQVDVSAELISTVTDAVIEDVHQWQERPLDAVYPIMYIDALQVKIKDQGHIVNKTVYLALGVNLHGLKEALGLWIEETEGAKFWLKIATELKNRGVKDIFIACVDGLKGLPEAIEAVFPKTEIQLCVVHLVRNSMRFVSYKDRKAVVADLKLVYRAATAEQAQTALEAFAKKWDGKYPLISKSWKNNWNRVIPFFAYPQDIRKAIYTTNAIESLNMTLRKIIKNRGSFPNDTAALKLLYLALNNISRKWTMPIKDWASALNQFTIIFENRVLVN